MTGDLADFLRAQLDADEQAARAARDAVGRDWEFRPVGRYDDEWALHDDAGELIFIADRCPPVVGVHIALHDPASVRADIAAKKAIVRRFLDVDEMFRTEVAFAPAHWHLSRVLDDLAQPYRGRDGWREEWQT